MVRKKAKKILEKTKKSLVRDLEEARKRLTEFRKRTTALAKKAREEAEKTARISRLRLEIIPLVQRRDRKLKEMGKKAYWLVKKGKISATSLKSLSDEMKDLEAQIGKKEGKIKKIKRRIE